MVDTKKSDSKNPKAQIDFSDISADVLAQPHVIYTKFETLWQEYHDLYEGLNVKRFIEKHIRESKQAVEARQKRSYYENVIASIIDLITDFVYRKTVSRIADVKKYENTGKSPEEVEKILDKALKKKDFIEMFWEKADGLEKPIEQLMRKAFIFCQVYGFVDILIIAPSKEDVKEFNIQANLPYMVLYTPFNVINWEMDKRGNFNWVRFKEVAPPDGNPFPSKEQITKKSESFVYTTWTKTEWIKHKLTVTGNDKSVEFLESGTHGLGIVPVLRLKNKESITYPDIGISALQDLADIAKALLRWNSLLDEELHTKCLNILMMPKPSEPIEELIFSASNIIEYDPNSAPPSYLVPSSEPAGQISQQIAQAKETMYNVAKLSGAIGIPGQGVNATSGVAYARLFNETNQMLSEKADLLERAENRLCEIVSKYRKKEWTGKVAYPDDFDLYDLRTEVELLLGAQQVVTSDTALKLMEKDAVVKLIPTLTADQKAKVFAEIDAAPGKNAEKQMATGLENVDAQGEEVGYEEDFGGEVSEDYLKEAEQAFAEE